MMYSYIRPHLILFANDESETHSTSWWSLFDCCRTPSASSLPSDEDHDDHCNESNNSFRFPFAPSINVVTKRGNIVAGEEGAACPETPSTACTGSSAGKEQVVEDIKHFLLCALIFSFTNILPLPRIEIVFQTKIIVICND